MSAHSDDQLLQRAVDLARAGIGLSSPNPYVGAVITDPGGNIVGEGTYTYASVKHAEILALEAAGAKARGGTLYINLEPHAHQGRTPPCTDALIYAGIRRVVACMADPNPKVSGKGFAQLHAAGIQVEVGKFEQEARRLNEAFARYIRHGMPFVTLKSAMSLDGKIAPPFAPNQTKPDEFSGTWLTGESARAHVHKLRHQHDAILAGIGTILADNPLLTDRSGSPRRRPLLRVILDSHLRLPLDSRIAKSASNGDLLVFCTVCDDLKTSQFAERGIRVENVSAARPHDRPDLHAVLRRLGELEITSLMIEGGSTVNAAALAAGVVDKVFLYYAPTILGASAVSFANTSELHDATDPVRLKQVQLHRFGEDFAVEGYLRDPYEESNR
jgi:diaminohydroxyphosphoribosylaminopyrimidine deaminase / 5-amino-6-(5-phosphoribosylamino)uracil reductase